MNKPTNKTKPSTQINNLRRSREYWKEKCQEISSDFFRLKNKIRFKDEQIDMLTYKLEKAGLAQPRINYQLQQAIDSKLLEIAWLESQILSPHVEHYEWMLVQMSQLTSEVLEDSKINPNL